MKQCRAPVSLGVLLESPLATQMGPMGLHSHTQAHMQVSWNTALPADLQAMLLQPCLERLSRQLKALQLRPPPVGGSLQQPARMGLEARCESCAHFSSADSGLQQQRASA